MIHHIYSTKFEVICNTLRRDLVAQAREVEALDWQSQDISGRPEMVPHELLNVSFATPVAEDPSQWAKATGCNLPWAEDHFAERVSGAPLNPPQSEAWWPYNKNQNAEHKDKGKFSHTYPERLWPKCAGERPQRPSGIRFDYGDLGDVVDLLRRNPHSRQAFLPIWFPEDTGAVHRGRVPCTLGYLFLIRKQRLHVT